MGNILVILILLLAAFGVYYFWFGNKKEGITQALARSATLEPSHRLAAILDDGINSLKTLVYSVVTPADKEIYEMDAQIRRDMQDMYNKMMASANPEKYLQDSGLETISNSLKSAAKPLIMKYDGGMAAGIFDKKFDETIYPSIKRMLSYSIYNNPYQLHNTMEMRRRIKDKLNDFNFSRQGASETVAREIKPMMPRKGGLDVRNRTDTDKIKLALAGDHPSIQAATSTVDTILPSGSAGSLDLALLTAANNRYRSKPSDSAIRGRGGDTRPLPKALVDLIAERGNSSDPNSLLGSSEYSIYDVLESGTGHSGNEHIKNTLDRLYQESDDPFLRDFDQISDLSRNKMPEDIYGEKRKTCAAIIQDVKSKKMIRDSAYY